MAVENLNTPNSFDCKLEGGKEGEAPPNPPTPPTHPIHLTASWRAGKRVRPPPTPYPDWAARAPLAVISSPGVCVWGGDQLVTGGGAGMRAKYSPPTEMTPDWGEEGATRHVCIELLLTD